MTKLQKAIDELIENHELEGGVEWNELLLKINQIAQLAEEEGYIRARETEKKAMIELFRECLPEVDGLFSPHWQNGFNACLSQIHDNLSNKGIEL